MATDCSAAVLFADIAGSTALFESAGDTVALDRVSRCLEKFRAIATAHAGKVIKTIGDEILCIFPVPDQAVISGSAMQFAMAQLSVGSPPLRIRVGIHFGPVVLTESDVFGDTVNVAARLVELANPEQILTTQATTDALSPHLQAVCRRLYATHVKGKNEKILLMEVIWRQDDNLTIVSSGPAAIDSGHKIVVGYRTRTLSLSNDSPPLMIGRDKESQLAVDIPTASRRHALLYLRQGKFILADTSSNGTVVDLDSGSTLRIHREELALTGSGSIGLGCTPTEAGDHAISFTVVN